MKVKRLALCVLLSVALTVTFIPMTAFGYVSYQDNNPPWEISQDNDEVFLDENGQAQLIVNPVDDQQTLYYEWGYYDEQEGDYIVLEGEETSTCLVTAAKYYRCVVSDSDGYKAYAFFDVQDGGFVGVCHPVTFEGVDSFTLDEENGIYYGELEHGKVILGYYDYDEIGNYFSIEEKNGFIIDFECDEGWEVDNVKYSIDGGATTVDADYSREGWLVDMPSDEGDYALKVYVTYVATKKIKSIDITVKAPVCGTVVKGNDYSGEYKHTPQPVVVVPSGSNYQLDTLWGNYGFWYKGDYSDMFNGKMKGGTTYVTEILLRAKKGYTFEENCTIRLNGGKLMEQWPNSNDNKFYLFVAQVKAVHDWQKGVVNPKAGLLKDGVQYDGCKKCTAIQNKKVIPGYATYYVKGLKVKKAKKSFTVKWKKQSKKNLKKFNGYQIRYSTAANMSGAKFATAGKKTKSKKIKGLQKKTTYYVQVRTFTKTGAGTFYSKWSPTKKVKTK